MRASAVAMLLVLVAGCAAPPPPSPSPGPSSTPTAPEFAGPFLVAIDGRWSFHEAPARALLAPALVPGAGVGSLLAGTMRFGRAEFEAFAPDARAAAILGIEAALPERGEVVLPASLAMMNVSEAVGVSWPSPRVITAFEMERVRPCSPASAAVLCIADAEGEIVGLSLDVPPESRDLSFHADVVELSPRHYPAYWNGTFTSPTGEKTPFATAARTRGVPDAPGRVPGEVEPGEWRIDFTLDLNGTRAKGAIAGFVTYTSRGLSPFATDLVRAGNATAEVVARAIERPLALTARVSNATTRALVHPDDARRLWGIPETEVTALLVPERSLDASAFAEGTRDSPNGLLRSLNVRPLPPPTREDALAFLAAPSAQATTLETRMALGGNASFEGHEVFPRIFAIPREVPFSLLDGGLWPDLDLALRGVADGPHLALASADLARDAGLDPGALSYKEIRIDSAIGPRTVFVMGAVEGGPKNALWVSPALALALGSPAGTRVVFASESQAAEAFAANPDLARVR